MDIHRKSVDLLTEELKQIGFGSISKAMVERELYPHYVGHPIGIGLFTLVFSSTVCSSMLIE